MKMLGFQVVLVVVLVVVAYLAGTLVAAGGSPSLARPSAPAVLTVNQLAAIEGANALLLDDETSTLGYLPLLMR